MAEKNKLGFSFPKKFLWGASISTYQVEGGNHNQWSSWELETASVKVAQAQYRYQHLSHWEEIKAEALDPNNYVSGRASDHFNRYKQDFEIARSLNFSVIRSGIEWSRIEPTEGSFSKSATEHYLKYFTQMKKQGIKPIVTLWHWTFPEWFAQKGGFAKRSNIKYFLRYVEYISQQLGEHLEFVITINEPTVYAAMSYYEERWPPEERSRIAAIYVMLNLAKAHNKSYRIIKKIVPNAKIGLAHNCAYYYAGDDSWLSRSSAKFAHKYANEWFVNRVKKNQDFFGLNYYFANKILGTRVHNSKQNKQNDLGWDMQPDKIHPLLNQLHQKYKIPFLITESGVADRKDVYRKWWIAQSIKAMDGAIKDGVPLVGYIHWSLLDNFEWAEGFWPRFGLIHVDYKTQKRSVRPSAKWYAQVIKTLRN